MNRLRVYFEESPSDTPMDTAINWLLIGIMAFAPLALGSIDPKFEMVTQTVVAIAAVMFCIKLAVFPQSRFIKSWVYLPMIVFIAWVALQTFPLPSGLVSIISPTTLKLKRDLLSDLPNVAEVTSKLRLTFYAEPTIRQLRLVLMVSAMFVMVLNQFRTLSQIKQVLIAMVCISGFSSLLAVVQTLSGTDSIYWSVYSGSGLANSGTFANHSHFGQFTNMGIGATLALFFLLLHEQFGSHYRVTDIGETLKRSHGKIFWALLLVIVLGAVAIILSLTRGGTLAMLVSGAICVGLLARQNREAGIGWLGAIVGLLVFAVLAYAGFDQISHRFSQFQQDEPVAFRGQMVLSCIDCWKDFSLTGIGLGAFRYVYPSYERVTTYNFATHAENEYAQLLMETGVIGFAMIAMFIALVFVAIVKTMRVKGSPFAVVVLGLGFGWVAILMQSLSDFGQHMPGVAITTATMTALIFSVARAATYDPNIGSDESSSASVVVRSLCAIATMAVGALCVTSTISVWRADAKWIEVLNEEDSLWKSQWDVEPKRIFAFLHEAQSVTEMRPSNVVYRYLFNQFRLRVGTLVRDPQTGKALVNDELIKAFHTIADEINQARPLCPTYGPLVASEGWTRRFLLNDSHGADLIDRAVKLAPNDPNTLRMAGDLDASRGQWDRATERFARYLAIYPAAGNEIVDKLVKEYRKPDIAIAVAGETPAATYLLEQLERENVDTATLEKLRRSVLGQLLDRMKKRTPDGNDYEAIAMLYAKLNDVSLADEYYARAVNTAAVDLAMRLRYAEFLDSIGKKEDAIKQVDQVLNVDPLDDAAVKLWRKLRGTGVDKNAK